MSKPVYVLLSISGNVIVSLIKITGFLGDTEKTSKREGVVGVRW